MKSFNASQLARWGAMILALIVVATLVSAQNPPVGKTHDVTLRMPAHVADTVIPAGTYRVTHLMQNDQHIMQFRSLRKDQKEYRVGCTMRELPVPVKNDEMRFEERAANDRVLTSLRFAGDKVEHVF